MEKRLSSFLNIRSWDNPIKENDGKFRITTNSMVNSLGMGLVASSLNSIETGVVRFMGMSASVWKLVVASVGLSSG